MQAANRVKEEQSDRLAGLESSFAELQQQLAHTQSCNTTLQTIGQQQLERMGQLESSSSKLQRLAERFKEEAAAAKVGSSLLCLALLHCY